MNGLIARIDDHGPIAWIGLMVVSFIIFWPAGLALLAFLIWSGRMGCNRGRGFARWRESWQERKHAWRAGNWREESGRNHAFDEYRQDTLRRLEEEEREFHEFLARLRQAKDREEFDQFMTERRRQAREEAERPSPERRGDEPQGATA